MASASSPQAQSTQGKRGSISSYVGGNASLLLEKTKAGMRRSTPDSEALASSDDEQDQRYQHSTTMLQQVPRPNRRASWLSEVQQGPQRKGSLTGTYSSVSSHPSTPATEPTSWPSSMGPQSGSTVGRGHSNSTSFPWGGTIWNSDAQKGPPSRLSEVLPSPTTVVPTGSSSFFGDTPLTSPPARRDSATDSSIPFAIPLHPTPKTYRSQSYSVGQLDPELTNGYPAPVQHAPSSRARVGSSYAGVQRRPSRPSMLGEFSHDTSVLEQLREVDDDEESATSSEAGVQLSHTQARTIEQLAMENAILRQQAAVNQLAASNAGYVSNSAANMSARLGGRTLQQQMSDSVLDEPEEMPSSMHEISIQQDFNQYGTIGRRFNELNANPGSQLSVTGVPENRKLESVKKGQWQSSLGFGGLAEIPQSRRHSFADVPTRHGSMSSAGDAQNGHLSDIRAVSGYNEGVVHQSQGDSGEYDHFRLHSRLEERALELEHLRNRNYAASYFSNADPSLRSPDLYRTSNSPSSMHLKYGIQSPHSRNQHSNHSHGHGQLLYLVTFKACRAEFYYIQEGTGLQVKIGDLVIVEADRGTDLGTVAQDNVDWASARDLKDQYAEEHYRWLMMFSRHGQNGSIPASNPNAVPSSNGVHASAVGGMGPPGQTSLDTPNAEIKPKMIKRLAQSHEIQTLKDKEGNEAKAKRMCQQKVAEHHLNMEILDAEFQMDWKKLTFYYFADSYINFNSLVTDLFKIYKTRIWMSAINPASFVTPTAGLQLPSGLGPGAITLDRDGVPRNRQKRENLTYMPTTMTQVPQASYEPVWTMGQDVPLSSSMIPNAYSQFYQPQVLQQMNPNLHDYGRGAQQVIRSQSPFGHQAYGAFNGIHQPVLFKPDSKNGASRLPYANQMNDWTGAFQGLSLGS